MHRSRLTYSLLIAFVIITGLASRSGWFADHIHEFIVSYSGDTLWALMVFLVVGFIFPRLRISSVAVAAIAISYTVEVSQFYQAGWINEIRATRLGALALGHQFIWSDLLCYTLGILIGAAGETLYHKRDTSCCKKRSR